MRKRKYPHCKTDFEEVFFDSKRKEFQMKNTIFMATILCGALIAYYCATPQVFAGEDVVGAASCNCSGTNNPTCQARCTTGGTLNIVTKCESGTTGICKKTSTYDCGNECVLNVEKCE